MSGIQEILLIVLIIVGLFLLPRLLNRGGAEPQRATLPGRRLGGGLRLALFASVLWAAAACLRWRPWEGDVLLFVLIGLGPVALAWGLAWVALGFRKRR